jgi:hypothetical protein
MNNSKNLSQLKNARLHPPTDEDAAVLKAIRWITNRGNDAEVKLKPDGRLRVYEVKRTSYP